MLPVFPPARPPRPVSVPPGYGSREELEAAGADYLAQMPEALMALLL